MHQKVQPSGSAGPVAHAGSDQIASSLALVTLDGSSSSGYSTIAWTLARLNSDGTTTDSTGLLSDATVAGPTFTPAVANVTYVATLTLDADSDAVDSVAVKIPAELTLDLTGATETNTGQKGGNTSLGTTNRIEIAAVHGRPDGGNDAYTATVQLTDKPAGATALLARMVCSTPDAAAAITTGAGLYLYVGTTAAPTSNQAYIGGWEWQAVGTRYRAKSGVTRLGSVPGGTTIIDAQADAGVLHTLIFVPLKADKPSEAMARVWGSDGSTDGLDIGNQASALTSGTDVYMGFVCDQHAATPGDVLDMQDVVFTYEWIS